MDGFISQKVGSFTPSASAEKNKEQDVMYHLRLGLFQILQDVLVELPDNLVTRLFGSVLKVEHLLVLVSQQNDTLREIAVQVGSWVADAKTSLSLFILKTRLVHHVRWQAFGL